MKHRKILGLALAGVIAAAAAAWAADTGQLNLGTAVFNGSSSGTVTVSAPAAAGTTTFTLPSSNGTNGFFLKTDGFGVTSWAAGGGVGSGCTTSGSSGQILEDNGAGGCTSLTDMTFATGTLSLGTATSEQGKLALKGLTSGTFTLSGPATASGTLTLPAGTTDFSATGGSNQVVQQTSAGGAFTVGQLGFSNLSGTNSVAQLGGSGASHATLVDVAGTPTWKVVPDCTDTGGNHLNYTQSSDAFSCGTSGSGASLSANNTWTKGQAVTPDTATACGTLSTSGTLTPNFANSNSCVETLAGTSLTIANPTNVIAGQPFIFELIQDGTGNRTVSWGTNYKWPNGSAPTLSTAASSHDIISCWASTTTRINCTLSVQAAS